MSDRKYKQRGYMDDGGPRERRFVERPRQEGPRGRGLGAPTKEVFRCRDCGEEVAAFGSIARDATCAACGVALHSCVNCSWFDTSARFECRRPIAAREPSKTKANECEDFAAKVTLERESDTAGPAPTAGKAAFDALFE